MGRKLDKYTSLVKFLSGLVDLIKQAWPWFGAVVAFAMTTAGAFLTQWGYIPATLFGMAAFVLILLTLKLATGMLSRGDKIVGNDTERPTGNVYVTSHNQSGGITAQNVHVNPQMQRIMGDKLKDGLLRVVPRNKRVVVWSSMGNQESHVFATEIFRFLRRNGFEVFGDSAHQQIFLTPLHGIELREDGENFNINVGLPDGSEKPQGL